MKKIIVYLKFIRFHNIAIGCVAIIISSLLLHKPNDPKIIFGILQVFFIMGFANSMNDILDFKVDLINHPNRVLVSSIISKKEAKNMCQIFLIGSFFISYFLPFMAQVFIYCIVFPLIILYNIIFKKIPLIGNLIISLLLASIFLFSEILLTNQLNILIVPSLLVATLSLIRELIKDMHDFYGDKNQNYKTLPVLLGIKKSGFIVSINMLISIFLFLLPYYFGIYDIKYLISLVILIEIPLIYSIFLLINYPSIKTFKQLVILHKFLSIAGLLVIILTK